MSAAKSLLPLLAAPGPHPDAEALRQYAAGTLAPAAEQRIEAHTLDCERCTDILQGLAMSDASTTDRAVAELRDRLQARVRDAAPLPVAGPGSNYQMWPRLAAAAAVAGLAAAGLWGWEHRTPASEPMLARTETAVPPAPATAPTAETAAPALADAAPVVAADKDVALASAPAYPARVAAGRVRAGRAAQPKATDTLAGLVAINGNAGVTSAPSSRAVAPALPDFALKGATEEEAADKDDKAAADSPITAAPPAPAVATIPRLETAKKSEAPTKTMAMQQADTRRAAPMPAGPTLAPLSAGGVLALREYLRREASSFDPVPNASRLSGTVRLRFVVNETGKLSDLKIVRGLRADYDAEALRMVCDGPAWQPGIAGGRRAALPVELTVPF